MRDEETEAEALARLLKAGGVDTMSSIGGTAVGLMIGGPQGALIGAGAGPFVASMLRVAYQVIKRPHGRRDEWRMGRVLADTIDKIDQKLAAGEQLRSDGFFDEKKDERPDAEEILEATLIAAQRDPAEKKLPFYGNLLANIAFHPEINKAQANLLLKLAADLSYRQLCLLRLFAGTTKDRYQLRDEDYSPAEGEEKSGLPDVLISLLQEILELTSRGMLNGTPISSLLAIQPSEMETQGTGASLHNYMELWGLPEEDIKDVAVLLSESFRPPLWNDSPRGIDGPKAKEN